MRPLVTSTVLMVALLAAGCAANDPPPSRVAGPRSEPEPRLARVELEDDGLPVQLAPRQRRPVVDDPTQPWSPNYGSAAAGAPALSHPARFSAARADGPSRAIRPGAPSPTVAPAAIAPAPTPVAVLAVSRPMDPDDIIRQAIAEHERRRR